MKFFLVMCLVACEGGPLDPPPPPYCSAVCKNVPAPRCDHQGECICELWNHRRTRCTPDPTPDAQ